MSVRRIVANIAAASPEAAQAFYGDILGLDLVMDLGFVRTYASAAATTPQVSIAAEGGSGTPVPDLSIEVDDLDEVLRRVEAVRWPIAYGPVTEPWGVRRFYLRDPFGRLVNILAHVSGPA